ncbi:GNAT family N-acetyltransferase [Peribacillus sp. SCS-37]|uniref:GNAT family N-acetyltransferase n=1 Tax=Paraperibacillus esterisolvens TaxID=3115296 RepID=UPI0039061EB7
MDTAGLRGRRAALIPMESRHIDGLYAAAMDEEIWEFMSVRIKRRQDMTAVVEAALQQRDAGFEQPFTVMDLESGSIVGSTRFLNILTQHKNLEIGWTWYNPSVWRTRVNTECKYLLLKHAFEELGMIRVQFKTDSRNKRSQAAIARLGAVSEGVNRHDRIMHDGYIRSSAVFSILKEEWPGVKENLSSILES